MTKKDIDTVKNMCPRQDIRRRKRCLLKTVRQDRGASSPLCIGSTTATVFSVHDRSSGCGAGSSSEHPHSMHTHRIDMSLMSLCFIIFFLFFNGYAACFGHRRLEFLFVTWCEKPVGIAAVKLTQLNICQEKTKKTKAN